jgi:hypothetical protein
MLQVEKEFYMNNQEEKAQIHLSSQETREDLNEQELASTTGGAKPAMPLAKLRRSFSESDLDRLRNAPSPTGSPASSSGRSSTHSSSSQVRPVSARRMVQAGGQLTLRGL